MAGIYIHIPFCRKACHYCNFHFSTTTALVPKFVSALLEECDLQRAYLEELVETIYFGGGTPSLLNSQDIRLILEKLGNTYQLNDRVEITLEANPDDITFEKLQGWHSLGITRLSIGVQSFADRDLNWMNRAHSAGQAVQALTLALDQGFNITIDLIYGTPTLTDEQWYLNVQTAINLKIPHLSCYALTVEPKTALDKMIKLNKVEDVDVEKQARHFELLQQWTKEAGYHQYEISNFALPGFESKHNSSYWQGRSYLGLGPSAHSFNGATRQWNVANNNLYITSIHQGIVPFEREVLSPEQQLNEYVMTGLRTSTGISLQFIEEKWGTRQAERIATEATRFINLHQARIDSTFLKLTESGKLRADGIAAELFA